MRFVPTRVHGMLDCLVGVLLVIVPLVVSSPGSGASFWVPAALGAGAIVYALLTDYELGVARLLTCCSTRSPACSWPPRPGCSASPTVRQPAARAGRPGRDEPEVSGR